MNRDFQNYNAVSDYLVSHFPSDNAACFILAGLYHFRAVPFYLSFKKIYSTKLARDRNSMSLTRADSIMSAQHHLDPVQRGSLVDGIKGNIFCPAAD